MGAFSTGFNIGFSSGMFNSMFRGFNAFNFGCWGFNNWNFNCWNSTPMFFTPNYNFGNFYPYYTPQPMVENIFNYNTSPNWLQNINYSTQTFNSVPTLIGDSFESKNTKNNNTVIETRPVSQITETTPQYNKTEKEITKLNKTIQTEQETTTKTEIKEVKTTAPSIKIKEQAVTKQNPAAKNILQERDTNKTKSTSSNSKINQTADWTKKTDQELQNIYGSYSKDITKLYEGNADNLNKYLKDKGVLKGMGQIFIDAQNTYGISASVLVGICMNETNMGTSNLAKYKKNVGGLRIPGSIEFQKFDKIEDSILEMARVLKVGYVNNTIRPLTKLYEINARYCPVTDTTDTKNINQYWAKNVNTYIEEVEKVSI